MQQRATCTTGHTCSSSQLRTANHLAESVRPDEGVACCLPQRREAVRHAMVHADNAIGCRPAAAHSGRQDLAHIISIQPVGIEFHHGWLEGRTKVWRSARAENNCSLQASYLRSAGARKSHVVDCAWVGCRELALRCVMCIYAHIL